MFKQNFMVRLLIQSRSLLGFGWIFFSNYGLYVKLIAQFSQKHSPIIYFGEHSSFPTIILLESDENFVSPQILEKRKYVAYKRVGKIYKDYQICDILLA